MKSFLAACGIEDSFQFVVESQDATQSRLRLLYQPFAVIGRDLRADVVLDHADISRRHVYLQVIDGRVFWIDLESRTGTRKDSESRRFGWLEEGRTLFVGPYTIRRSGGDSQAIDKRHRGEASRITPLVARPSPHVTQSEVALEFLNGPSRSMLKPVHRVLSLIGSAGGCKFRLTDSSVSKFHGSLLQTSFGLWIVDLLGQKGISINDVPVRCSRLVDGDIVRIGRYQIRIRSLPHSHGTRTGSLGLEHALPTPNVARQSHTLASLNSTHWMPTIATPSSGSVNAQESSSLSFEASSTVAKIDLIPLNSLTSGNLRQVELTESVLAPLVNQFGMMQQQMFDQFQQAMVMMIQMFGTMHRDQMEVIRAEFDQLHELTNEFHALKNELAELTREKAESETIEPTRSPAGFHRSTSVDQRDPPTQLLSSEQATSSLGQAGQAHVPSPQPSIPKMNEQQSSPESIILSTQSSSTSPAQASISEPSSQTSQKLGSTDPIPDSDRDTVLWLHQRIMVLQRERESRWQKILKLIPGMSAS